VAAELLLDTGPFVALVDRSEALHEKCVAVLEIWTGPVVTTEAVLTETLYLVGPRWSAQKVALEFIFRGAFQLVPSSHASLQRVGALMERYSKCPDGFCRCDFASAGRRIGKPTRCSHWIAMASLPTEARRNPFSVIPFYSFLSLDDFCPPALAESFRFMIFVLDVRSSNYSICSGQNVRRNC
jgi:hypothetical protein